MLARFAIGQSVIGAGHDIQALFNFDSCSPIVRLNQARATTSKNQKMRTLIIDFCSSLTKCDVIGGKVIWGDLIGREGLEARKKE